MAAFYGTDDRDTITVYQDLSDGVTSDPAGLLRTTSLADLIFGYGGSDIIYGGGGHDTIHAGDGNDYIVDGQTDTSGDHIFGEAGDDYIFIGNDLGDSVSHIDGGTGNDIITGQGTLIGGSGKDSIYGDGTLSGGAGNDYLWGGPGDALLRGGSGEDTLSGSGGTDTLIGGSGNDTFVFTFPEGDPSPSAPDAPDVIRAASGSGIAAFEGAGAEAGDKLLFEGFDVDPLVVGIQPLIFGGRDFGHIWIGENGTRTLVFANLDDDAAPEFKLAISDGDVRASEYTADDFIL